MLADALTKLKVGFACTRVFIECKHAWLRQTYVRQARSMRVLPVDPVLGALFYGCWFPIMLFGADSVGLCVGVWAEWCCFSHV